MTKHNKKMAQNNSRRPKMTKNDAKKLSVTDGRTDGPTDRAGCRVACTRLKTGHFYQKTGHFYKGKPVLISYTQYYAFCVV